MLLTNVTLIHLLYNLRIYFLRLQQLATTPGHLFFMQYLFYVGYVDAERLNSHSIDYAQHELYS